MTAHIPVLRKLIYQEIKLIEDKKGRFQEKSVTNYQHVIQNNMTLWRENTDAPHEAEGSIWKVKKSSER